MPPNQRNEPNTHSYLKMKVKSLDDAIPGLCNRAVAHAALPHRKKILAA